MYYFTANFVRPEWRSTLIKMGHYRDIQDQVANQPKNLLARINPFKKTPVSRLTDDQALRNSRQAWPKMTDRYSLSPGEKVGIKAYELGLPNPDQYMHRMDSMQYIRQIQNMPDDYVRREFM